MGPLKGAKDLPSAAGGAAAAALFYSQSIELLLVMPSTLANVVHRPAVDELRQLSKLKGKRPLPLAPKVLMQICEEATQYCVQLHLQQISRTTEQYQSRADSTSSQ